MPIDGQKIREFFTRSGSPTKEQSAGKGPVTAALATAAIAGIGKAIKGRKDGKEGKKPIRTAIKNVKAKIEAKKDFKAQQKAMKPQTPAAPKFKAPKGSKVTKYVKNYGSK
jgi:hypothetical protein